MAVIGGEAWRLHRGRLRRSMAVRRDLLRFGLPYEFWELGGCPPYRYSFGYRVVFPSGRGETVSSVEGLKVAMRRNGLSWVPVSKATGRRYMNL